MLNKQSNKHGSATQLWPHGPSRAGSGRVLSSIAVVHVNSLFSVEDGSTTQFIYVTILKPGSGDHAGDSYSTQWIILVSYSSAATRNRPTRQMQIENEI